MGLASLHVGDVETSSAVPCLACAWLQLGSLLSETCPGKWTLCLLPDCIYKADQLLLDGYHLRLQINSSEIMAIKEKLVSFVNAIKEEAESMYQDKFQSEDFPAAAKRKPGKAR